MLCQRTVKMHYQLAPKMYQLYEINMPYFSLEVDSKGNYAYVLL